MFWLILVRTYMEGLPKELEEAAKTEGANDFKIFVKIVLPICAPVLATITLFSAIYHWNSWYDSYIYTYKIMVYPFLQKYFIKGILIGAIKD